MPLGAVQAARVEYKMKEGVSKASDENSYSTGFRDFSGKVGHFPAASRRSVSLCENAFGPRVPARGPPFETAKRFVGESDFAQRRQMQLSG